MLAVMPTLGPTCCEQVDIKPTAMHFQDIYVGGRFLLCHAKIIENCKGGLSSYGFVAICSDCFDEKHAKRSMQGLQIHPLHLLEECETW